MQQEKLRNQCKKMRFRRHTVITEKHFDPSMLFSSADRTEAKLGLPST